MIILESQSERPYTIHICVCMYVRIYNWKHFKLRFQKLLYCFILDRVTGQRGNT